MTERPLRIGSLASGYGGLDVGVMAVWRAQLVWCAEIDAAASAFLAAHFPEVPNLGDIKAIDWHGVPPVDVVTAGFPCQDISLAGRGAGIKQGTRSGLWITITDALRSLRPRYVVVENVAGLRRRGLDRVLGDLAALGYDAAWTSVRAADVGAPHRRERVFILAYRPGIAADTASPRR